MKTAPFVLALAFTTLAAAPPPSPEPLRQATIVCRETPLYVWSRTDPRPRRSGPAGLATLGETFRIVSGPRTGLDSFSLYELDIPIVETGFGSDEHYWIARDCVSVTT